MIEIKKERQRGFEVVSSNFRKHPLDIELPRRATKKSCGYDIYSPISAIIQPNEKLLIWTDIKAYMQEDECLEINTRSGNGTKKDVILANTIGWVDSDYYNNMDNDGNIGICLKNTGSEIFIISKYDKIAQVKFSKYLITDDDSPVSEERNGGFGHTGA